MSPQLLSLGRLGHAKVINGCPTVIHPDFGF